MRIDSTGASAAVRRASISAARSAVVACMNRSLMSFFLHVLRQPQALSDDEHEQAAGCAEQFEIHPLIGRVVISDEQVEQTEQYEKHCPDQVQLAPDRVRQRNLLAHHRFDQILVEDELR